MTWWSTSCRKLREAKQHGGVPNAPAVIKPNDTNGGFTWFFDAASRIKSKPAKEASNTDIGDPEQHVDATKDSASVVSADEELNAIIIKNPEMIAASLPGVMKSKGLKVEKVKETWVKLGFTVRKSRVANRESKFQQAMAKLLGRGMKVTMKKEADSTSAFTQVTRERNTLPANFRLQTNKMREADRDNLGEVDEGHKLFEVQLIEEGLGNFNDAYYYHREALESAVPLFTGLKIYADHPSILEEETRPERSVRDILGHFENLSVSGDKEEQAKLVGKVDVLSSEKWAIARMQRAIENAKKFPDKDFVGLSINAAGDAEETPIDEVISWAPASARPKLIEAKANGIDSVKVVRNLKSAISCDFVTEAGAGGKILNFIEGSKNDGKKGSR